MLGFGEGNEEWIKSNLKKKKKEQDKAQWEFRETAQSLVWSQWNDGQVYEEPGH